MYPKTESILVPVDFSEQSIIALKQSYNIARYYNAKIILTHVITGKLELSDNAYFSDDLDYINDKLVKLNKDIKEDTNLETEIIIEKGKIVPTILEIARKKECRFIFIGTRRNSIGPVSLRLIKEAPCPVFSIKGTDHKKGCDKIILPLDLTKTTTEKVEITYNIAKYFRSQVKVVSAYTPEDKLKLAKIRLVLEQVRDYFVNKEIACSTNLLSATKKKNNITDILLNYADEVKGDLIIIMIQQENPLKERFIGSLAKRIIMESDIPVLCVKPD